VQIPSDEELVSRYLPDRAAEYFGTIQIGSTPQSADQGAQAILAGEKTTTSSLLSDYASGKTPFVGALSVLVDGKCKPRAVIQTVRVDIVEFGKIEDDFAIAYGEGDRTLEWFQREMGEWYKRRASSSNDVFSEQTLIVCEWITVLNLI
jgi:uncharacterized protein YhfF